MFGLLHRLPRSAAVIAVAALLCYAPGLWWGAPHATGPDRKLTWGTDDETPLGPLAELHNIIAPKENRNLGYPLMYSFMAAGAYAPYLGWMKVSGGWKKVSGEYPWGFEDPVGTLKALTYISHFVTVCLAVGLVLCVFFAARITWGPMAGWGAGLTQLLSYPFFYYGRTGNVDAPMVFFIGVATLALAMLLKRGVTVRWALVLGAGMGFAVGTKESCYSILALMIPLLLWHHFRSAAPQERLSWPFFKPVVAAGVAGILAFGFGSGLFIEPSRYIAHIEFHRALAATVAAGDDHMAHFFDDSLAGHLGLAWSIIHHVTAMVSWPGFLLSLGGLAVLAYRRDVRGLMLVLPCFAFLAAMPLHLRLSQLRYVLPASPGLAIAVGACIAFAFSQPRWAKSALLAVFAVGLSISGLRALDLTHAMLNDSRYSAGAWLQDELRPGDRIDFFGGSERLPPLPADVRTARAAPHMSAHKVAPKGPEIQAQIRTRWTEDPPRFVIVMPDHSSRFGPHHHTLPPATFAALEDGSLGYDRVAMFKTPPLVSFMTRPPLDYPMVNPPIRIYAPRGQQP